MPPERQALVGWWMSTGRVGVRKRGPAMREVLADVDQWLASGRRVALATVISVVGSAPRGIGAALAISDQGEISGSVSGGCVEPAVIEECLHTIATGRTVLLKFGITEEQNVEQIGLSCGGEIRVFVERAEGPLFDELRRDLREGVTVAQATVIRIPEQGDVVLGAKLLIPERGDVLGSLGDAALDRRVTDTARARLARGDSGTFTVETEHGEPVEVFIGAYDAPPSLVVIGAGHVSIPLTRMAKVLGYRVVVVDAREAFATRERLSEADELIVEWPDDVLRRIPLNSSTAVAVLTHDEKFDVPALAVALRSGAGYVGAIGSKGTRAQRDARLRDEGITDEQIARIHGPIGLDIGARKPEEIALAILAEIVATRSGKLALAV